VVKAGIERMKDGWARIPVEHLELQIVISYPALLDTDAERSRVRHIVPGRESKGRFRAFLAFPVDARLRLDHGPDRGLFNCRGERSADTATWTEQVEAVRALEAKESYFSNGFSFRVSRTLASTIQIEL
jgi:hypothetical protein